MEEMPTVHLTNEWKTTVSYKEYSPNISKVIHDRYRRLTH